MKKVKKYVSLFAALVLMLNLCVCINVYAQDGIFASVSHDADSKTLKVEFLLPLTDAVDFSDTALFALNGGENIPIWLKSASETKVVFGYYDALKQGSGYLLRLPDGIEGLSDNRLYFAADSGFDSVSTLWQCDYSQNASVYTAVDGYNAGQSGPNYFEDGEHGGAWAVWLKDNNSADYNIPLENFGAVTGDLSSLSFSMKPLEDLKLDISFMTYNNKTPVNIGFFNNYGIRVGRAWQFASSTEKLSDYTPGNWYSVKLVYDKTQNHMWIYINGALVKELDSEYLVDYTGIEKVRFMVSGNEATSARAVLVLDDFKAETVERKTAVENVLFNGENGALSKTDGTLASTEIVFSDEITLSEAEEAEVSLVCDGTVVPVDKEVTGSGKVLKLTPQNGSVDYKSAEVSIGGNEKTGAFKTFTVSGTYDEVNRVEIKNVDEELHRIELGFSKRVSNAVLNKAVLISTRTGKSEKLSVESNFGNEAVLNYKNALDGSAEYAVVFPDNAKDIFGGTLSENILYFASKSVSYKNSKDNGSWSNYDDDAARVYTTFYGAVNIDDIFAEDCNRNQNLINTGDIGYNKAWKVDVVKDDTNSSGTWLGNNNIWWYDLKAPTGDLSAVRFSLKPIKWQNTLIQINDGSGKAFGVALRPYYNGKGALRYGKTLYAGSANDGLKHNGSQLTYNANEWVDFKIVRDKVKNTMDIYVNGEIAASLDSDYLSGYTGFEDKTENNRDWFIRVMTQPGQVAGKLGDTLFYMDNIYVYDIESESGVVKATYSGSNKSFGSFAKADEKINSIKFYLSEDIDETEISKASISIKDEKGNTVEVDSVSYDKNEKVLTIVPKVDLGGIAKYNVSVSGLLTSDGDNELGAYNGYILLREKGMYSIGEISIIDENGSDVTAFAQGQKVFVKLDAVNCTENEDKTAVIIATEYISANELAKTSVFPITLRANDELHYCESGDDVIDITLGDDTKEIKIFMWDSLENIRPIKNFDSAVLVGE